MSIENQVLAIVSEIVQKPVQLNEELLATGLIDSMSAMDLVIALKQKLDIDLPFEHLVDVLVSTSTLVEFVKKNKS